MEADDVCPPPTGCLKTKESTATVTTREPARRIAGSAPATFTIAMIQPPNTSPDGSRSAGIGITRRARGLLVRASLEGRGGQRAWLAPVEEDIKDTQPGPGRQWGSYPRLGDPVAALGLGPVEGVVGHAEQGRDVVAVLGKADTPRLTVTRGSSGRAITARRTLSATCSSWARLESGEMMTNSSPPQRHTRSERRMLTWACLGHLLEDGVADQAAEVVVHAA